jgi:hypothetical protein
MALCYTHLQPPLLLLQQPLYQTTPLQVPVLQQHPLTLLLLLLSCWKHQQPVLLLQDHQVTQIPIPQPDP